VQIAIPRHRSTADTPVRRAYSMANFPGEAPGELVLNVRVTTPPYGAGCTFLFHAAPGDRLSLYGPFGTFHATDGEREMVFIGGGAGMAPLRAIILDQLRNQRTQRRIHYWYGARSGLELYYADDFAQLAREFANFSWHPALSEANPADLPIPTGHIHEVVLRELLASHADPTTCDYYLCGPPIMLDACRRMLRALHVPNEQVFFDDFGN
jgi:Na+-transporting NADH:ubiquinone oxidoreductase subunit F